MAIKALSKESQLTSSSEPEKNRKLLNVHRNLGMILDRIGDFLNIQKKLDEMEVLIKDEANYSLIFFRLENLKRLRDSLQSTLKGSQSLKNFASTFQEIDQFETKFNQ